ncbi:hypothetical protein [Flavobacterium sp.]|uniref:hypothetical protein n=1 Tax=Flavobacterium sp. TaxID=239 RepID=UPI00404724D9
MKINFNAGEGLEIIKKDKSKKFNINEIDKLYVTYDSCLIFKKYYLNIKTKSGINHTIHINKKNKSKIKRQVCFLRVLINWTKKFNQNELEFS